MSNTSLPPSLKKQLDLLDQSMATFIAELQQHSNEQLNAPGAGGGWSALQCVEHIKLSERGIINYIQKKLSFNPDLPKKGFTDSWRKLILVGYLSSPFKFKAPKGVGTEYLPSDIEINSSIASWHKEREEFHRAINNIDPIYHDKQVFKHPLAGRISLEATLAFMQAHLERHRRQALRAIKQA